MSNITFERSLSEPEFCVTCKHYVHNVITQGSGRQEDVYCKLDREQVVYLFTDCKIGKWEAKDDPA
jgi:hypothetical protein